MLSLYIMKYCFNLKNQLIYGFVTFLFAFVIIYLIDKEINWITPIVIGITEFIIAGFFTNKKCK